MSSVPITVLMTVYNGAKFLHKAIDSVLAQTHADFEFLIVDDKSTDNSLEILRSYTDPRVRIIANPANIGQTCSLNVGLHQARGKYIARMDADDMAYPDWLMVQMRVMMQYPTCAVLSPRAALIDVHDKVHKTLNTPLKEQDIMLKSLFASPINHVGSLMKKEIIIDAGGYDERYKIVADYALWCKLLAEGIRIVNHKQILVAVRTHANSISVMEADNRVMKEMVEVYQSNIAFWTKRAWDPVQLMAIWRLVYTPDVLPLYDFQEAMKLFRSMFVALDLPCVPYYLKQEETIFLKRIWNFILKQDFENVRATANSYMQVRGISNVFVLIWALSFCGAALSLLLTWYRYCLGLLAHRKAA